jgi:hypothetical protein
VDNVTGTPNNDTIIGTVVPLPTASTLNVGDQIDGGGGNNTLKILDTAGSAGDELLGVTLTNIQTVSVQNLLGLSVNADFAANPGVSKVIAFATAANGTDNFTSLATGAQVVASGANTASSTNLNYQYTTPTDAVSLGVDGGVNGVQSTRIQVPLRPPPSRQPGRPMARPVRTA